MRAHYEWRRCTQRNTQEHNGQRDRETRREKGKEKEEKPMKRFIVSWVTYSDIQEISWWHWKGLNKKKKMAEKNSPKVSEWQWTTCIIRVDFLRQVVTIVITGVFTGPCDQFTCLLCTSLTNGVTVANCRWSEKRKTWRKGKTQCDTNIEQVMKDTFFYLLPLLTPLN